jgi:hypothetical protein
MKIFVSSLISGMEQLRAAVRAAIISLGHEPVMAEDFGARPQSPQVSCLDALRGCDAVVLILGARYGFTQPSGLSATHEEFREARERIPVLAFAQAGAQQEPAQAAFVKEVRGGWATGLFSPEFTDPEDLRGKVTRALHDWQLARAAGPFDADELLTRALAPFENRHGSHHGNGPTLILSLAGGPAQAILRPSEIEDPRLGRALQKEALFGDAAIFDPNAGSQPAMEDSGKLVLRQDPRLVALGADGGILVRLTLEAHTRGHWLSALIEEVVAERLAAALRYAIWLLDRVDPTARLAQVGLAVRIEGGGHMAWRTRAEHAASPNSMSLPIIPDEPPAVHLTPAHRPRAALRFEADRIAEDLLTLLRRQWKA